MMLYKACKTPKQSTMRPKQDTKAKHAEQEQTCRLISSQARVEAKVTSSFFFFITLQPRVE